MKTYPVSAAEDITFSGGMLLAAAGARGLAVAGMAPNRPQHYGLVPVRWSGRTRAFWVDRSKLRSRYNLDACITPAPVEELDLTIPEGVGSSFSFGRNLKLFRHSRGLSQAQLAERMRKRGMPRISQTSISNWENRCDCPSGRFLEVAAEVLEVPAFTFFIRLECVRVEDCLGYIQGLRRHIC